MRAPDLFRGEMYFHALRGDKRLRYSDRRVVELRKELKASRRAYKKSNFGLNAPEFPEICEFGMHACRSAEKCALRWININDYLCAVRLSGYVQDGAIEHKSVGMRRKVVAWRKVNGADWRAIGRMADREIYLWILAGPENK